MPAVVADPNVDCVIVVCYFHPAVVDVFRGLIPQISASGKPVILFGYGFDLASMEESARGFQTLGLPAYLDAGSAVKAMGIGAACARIRRRLNGDGTQ